MTFKISDIISRGLVGGGARPSLFDVSITYGGINFPEDFKFLCRATSAPASTIGHIEIPYFGRKIKLAGDRTFENWNTTIMNDEDFDIRNKLEQWHNSINTITTNLRTVDNYKAQATVTQYSKTGDSKPIKTYNIVNCFPLNIADMPLDWDTTNQIQTFNVTWAYDYWTSDTTS
jgi:hypothetical protein